MNFFGILVIISVLEISLVITVGAKSDAIPTIKSNVKDNVVNNKDVKVIAKVDSPTTKTQKSHIAKTATVGVNVNIGNHVHIKRMAWIGNNSTIGNGVTICAHASLGKNVTVSKNSHIGKRANIKSFANLSANSSVGRNAYINSNTTIGCSSTVGRLALIDTSAQIFENVTISKEVYIGQFVYVRKNATVGARAVVHYYADIPEFYKVPSDKVIVSAPTNRMLFNVIKRKSCDAKSDIFAQMEAAKKHLLKQCENSDEEDNIKFTEFADIAKTYLQMFYGDKDFKKYKAIVDLNSNPATDSKSDSGSDADSSSGADSDADSDSDSDFDSNCGLDDKFAEVIHFSNGLPNKIITNKKDVKTFITLWTIFNDLGRSLRQAGDTKCVMIKRLINGQNVDVVNPHPKNCA